MGPNRSLTVLTSMVLCACYIMTATLFLGLKNFNSFLMDWGKDLQMTVYLKDEADATALQNLITFIKAQPSVQEVKQITSEENFSHFKNQMGSLFPQVENEKEVQALVPSTLQIIFDLKNSLADPLQIFTSVASLIKSQPNVDQVSYGQLWVEKFSKFFSFIRQAFWLIALILICASVFVFSNAVRAWVNSKRSEIEVYELVGATSWSIRKPFVIKGTFLGFATGCVALGITLAVIENLKIFMAASDLLSGMAQRIQTFTLAEGLAFILFSTGLGIFASYLCVREINSGWAAAERN